MFVIRVPTCSYLPPKKLIKLACFFLIFCFFPPAALACFLAAFCASTLATAGVVEGRALGEADPGVGASAVIAPLQDAPRAVATGQATAHSMHTQHVHRITSCWRRASVTATGSRRIRGLTPTLDPSLRDATHTGTHVAVRYSGCEVSSQAVGGTYP